MLLALVVEPLEKLAELPPELLLGLRRLLPWW